MSRDEKRRLYRPYVNKRLMTFVAIRKERMKEQRDYFASEGESDPERLAAQHKRDQEFIRSLKKIGIGFIIFLIFYAILRTILGLW